LSVLGLDGKTPKKDFWKLSAAISLLNHTSWSLANLDSGGTEKISLRLASNTSTLWCRGCQGI
jgi:hypothetical protein